MHGEAQTGPLGHLRGKEIGIGAPLTSFASQNVKLLFQVFLVTIQQTWRQWRSNLGVL